MASDQFTQVTTTSWLKRLAASFKAIGFGLLLFVLAFPVLWWNEGRAVKTAKGLEEGAGVVVSIPERPLQQAYAGRLVHLSGEARTDARLSDPDFAIEVNAIRLVRKVEMFQWQERKQTEERTQLGGSTETVTTYSYSKGWAEGLINSSQFAQPQGHQNPASMPYASRNWSATAVQVGDFTLNASQINMIPANQPLNLSTAHTVAPPAAPATDTPEADAAPDVVSANTSPRVQRLGEMLYLGDDPHNPQIGDLRITYSVAYPQTVSIIARQSGTSFEAYRTQHNTTINLLYPGQHSAEAMFASEHSKNTLLLWILRLVGFVMMSAGLKMVLGPLGVLADVIPLFGTIVRAGTGLMASTTAVFFSFFTIGLAWLFYRPLLGIGLLLISAAGITAATLLLKKNQRSVEHLPTSKPNPS